MLKLCCLNCVSADLVRWIDDSCLAVRLSDEAAAIEFEQRYICHV